MKKILFILCSLIIGISYPIASYANTNEVEIEPRSSYVFGSVGSAISPSAYGGDCTLVATGSGTVTISLQKYASASNSWVTMAGPSSKSFSNSKIGSHSKSKILTKGKWRCKTYVKASANGHTDSRTVYSGTITIN